MLNGDERTNDLYESSGSWPQLPLPPLPSPGDLLSSLETVGVRLTPVSRAISQATLWLTGFPAFLKHGPEAMDTVLRRTNIHNYGLAGMPATTWSVSNVELTAALQSALESLRQIILQHAAIRHS
jgi:hypothetical protein